MWSATLTRGPVYWWKCEGHRFVSVNAGKWLQIIRCSHSPLSKSELSQLKPIRYYGQPVPATHPHLLGTGQVTPGIQQEEFRQRRLRLMEEIGKHNSQFVHKPDHHVVIIASAVKTFMSEKIPYFFHQNTDFLYTTGFQEPNSVLVMHKESDQSFPNHRAIMFVQKRDPLTELWDGPRSGTDGAVQLLGIDDAYEIEELPGFLSKISQSAKLNFVVWYDFYNPANQEAHKTIASFVHNCSRASCESPRPLLQRLRLIKSPSEIALLQQSADIASEAFIEVMRSCKTKPCLENNLHARMDYECRIRGAEFLAYPPVVAGGNRANIIHYINNNQQIKDDELVLMDAGCSFHGYVSDITRTWSVGSKFSPAQRVLYETVLEIQSELLKQCHIGSSLDKLFMYFCRLLAKKLQALGIIPKNAHESEAVRMAQQFCPHHISHYMGMDVHDSATIPRTLPLQKGVVFTIEPGIYINENIITVPKEFRGIGIRIEDDVLMTESGPMVLSKNCPKQVDDLENLMSTRKV